MFPADVPTPLVAIKSIARIDAAALAALPADGREAALEAEIAAAAESGNAVDALRSSATTARCAGSTPRSGLTEGRMALAVEDRRRALFALAEVLATTEASQPAYAAATELYREATENPVSAELLRACSPPAVPAVPDGSVVTAAEMVASQRQVRDFVAAGEAYRACLATIIDDEERPRGCATPPSTSTTAWSRRWKKWPPHSTSRSEFSRRAADAVAPSRGKIAA